MPTDPLAPLFACGPTMTAETERAILGSGPALAHHLVAILRNPGYDASDAPGFGYARAHAARLLQLLDEERSIPQLTRALIDTARLPVAAACLRALASFGPAALDPLFAVDVPPGPRARRVLVTLICLGVRDDRILVWLGATIHNDPWFGSLLAETYNDPAILPQLEAALDRLLASTSIGHRKIGAVEVLRKAILSLGGEVDGYHGAVMERIAHDVRDGRLLPGGTPAPRPLWPELGLSQAGR